MAVAISAAAAQLECAFILPSICNSCVPKTALDTWKDHAYWTILVSRPVGKSQGPTLLLDKLFVIFFTIINPFLGSIVISVKSTL